MTRITLELNDDLANKLASISHLSHRTVQSLIILCVLVHLPNLMKAAESLKAFVPPDDAEPAPTHLDPTPDRRVEDPAPRRHKTSGYHINRNPQPTTKLGRDAAAAAELVIGKERAFALAGLAMRQMNQDLTWREICRQLGIANGNTAAMFRLKQDPATSAMITEVLNHMNS